MRSPIDSEIAVFNDVSVCTSLRKEFEELDATEKSMSANTVPPCEAVEGSSPPGVYRKDWTLTTTDSLKPITALNVFSFSPKLSKSSFTVEPDDTTNTTSVSTKKESTDKRRRRRVLFGHINEQLQERPKPPLTD